MPQVTGIKLETELQESIRALNTFCEWCKREPRSLAAQRAFDACLNRINTLKRLLDARRQDGRR